MREGCGVLESRGLFRRGGRPEPIEAFWFVEREKACRDMTTVTTLCQGVEVSISGHRTSRTGESAEHPRRYEELTKHIVRLYP